MWKNEFRKTYKKLSIVLDKGYCYSLYKSKVKTDKKIGEKINSAILRIVQIFHVKKLKR